MTNPYNPHELNYSERYQLQKSFSDFSEEHLATINAIRLVKSGKRWEDINQQQHGIDGQTAFCNYCNWASFGQLQQIETVLGDLSEGIPVYSQSTA